MSFAHFNDTIGGVTIIAIRKGRGDVKGSNQAFMHSLTFALLVSAILCILGTCVTGPLCRLMGASETYYEMSAEYLFYYSIFIIPSGLSTALQEYCRNDGSPVLISIGNVVGAAANIILDYVFIFPLQMGLSRPICGLFGATGETLDYTVKVMPLYAWGFLLTAFNTIISAYLFSTERTTHAGIINVLRSFAVNTFVILVFPLIFGNLVIWHTFGTYEAIVLVAAVALVLISERHGIVFKQSKPSAAQAAESQVEIASERSTLDQTLQDEPEEEK